MEACPIERLSGTGVCSDRILCDPRRYPNRGACSGPDKTGDYELYALPGLRACQSQHSPAPPSYSTSGERFEASSSMNRWTRETVS